MENLIFLGGGWVWGVGVGVGGWGVGGGGWVGGCVGGGGGIFALCHLFTTNTVGYEMAKLIYWPQNIFE